MYEIKSGTLSPMCTWHGSPKGRDNLSSCLENPPLNETRAVSKSNVFERIAVLHCLHFHAVLCANQHETSSKQHNGKVRLPRDKKTPPPRPGPRGLGRRRRCGLAGTPLGPLDPRQQRAHMHPPIRFH